MSWNRLGRIAGMCTCFMLVVGTVAAQDLRTVPGPEGGGAFPPPTFFSPPGSATNGAIIMHPPIPPGNVPQVIWQSGDEMQEVIKPSDHWVGVQCGRMDAALRAQLGLDEEQGVLVVAVVDDSPAAKGGIEKYDVLVQAGDRKLTKVQDLIDEVDAVKDGKLSVVLIRKAKKKTLELTPEKRPAMEAPSDKPAEDTIGEWKDFFEHMKQWEPGKDGRPSMKFRFWRQPGTILPSPPKPGEKVPDNVKIHINKEGDQPAEIEVTRDGESWSVKEDELDKLPADLRPHVERMLGKPKPPVGWPGFPPEGFKVPKPLEGGEGVLDRRFEDMNRRFDRIEKSLEKLFDRPKPKDAPKDKPKADPEPKEPPKPKAPAAEA